MKKKIGLITAIIIGAATLGIGIYQSDAVHGDPDLSQDEIREIVQSQYPGEITEITLESDAQTAVYEVMLEFDGKGYALSMDGNTGDVLAMQEEALQETHQEDDPGDIPSEPEHSEAQEKEEVPDETDEPAEPDRESSVIGSEEAQRIALNEFEGTVTSLELDEEDGRFIYEVEIERGDHEAEIEIDAYTGEILVISIDIDD